MQNNLSPFLLKIILGISLSFSSFSNAYSGICKDLDIDGPTTICSPVNSYSINYDDARCVTWSVNGGSITKINGKSIMDFIADFPINFTQPAYGVTSITGISFCKGGWGTLTVNSSTQGVFNEDVGQVMASWLISFTKNPAGKIEVTWDNSSYSRSITVHGTSLGALGVCGSGVITKDITRISGIPSFTLNASQTNVFCNQGVQISGAPGGGTSYVWNTSGSTLNSNSNTGISISQFSKTGVVPISVTVSNQCNSVTKTININVTQPDFGPIQQNNNDVGVVTPDCQGNFYLGMPVWVSNSAYYTWTLPSEYNAQTNTYTTVTQKGYNIQNIHGTLPAGALTDFVGKVTISGLCGAPVVKTFIVRPSLQPSVDPDIYSCTNTVVIKVNNPNAGTPINPYVWYTNPPGGWGTFTNTSTTSSTFTASSRGDFTIRINLTDANGCYIPLVTTVHAGSAGYNHGTTAGWQSGVLSDNRVKPGSNLAIYNSNIYFGGRDGKIYFYSYSTALQKWVINQIPGITNAAIPAGSSFNKIGIATLGTTTYLFYIDNAGFFKKVDLITNNISDGFGLQLVASDLIGTGNDVYAIEKSTNILKTIVGSSVINLSTLSGATLKTIVPGYGVTYIQNNNLYSTTAGQLTYTNDVSATSDVVPQNGYVYYARGQKGTANLFRFPLSNFGAVEQITTTSKLSGVFTINPASGVIYYGVLDNPIYNTAQTVTSGTYKAANIYQAHLQNGSWVFNAATTVKPSEDLDMYIQSPVFNGNHVFYIGAGGNQNIGSSLELEVWNLYYENACAPALQRVTNTPIEKEVATSVNMYPNPFTNTLQLDLSAYTDTETGVQTTAEIEILDASGKLVYTNTLLSELTALSTADWATGMYLVKIKHNGSILTKKAVKIN